MCLVSFLLDLSVLYEFVTMMYDLFSPYINKLMNGMVYIEDTMKCLDTSITVQENA